MDTIRRTIGTVITDYYRRVPECCSNCTIRLTNTCRLYSQVASRLYQVYFQRSGRSDSTGLYLSIVQYWPYARFTALVWRNNGLTRDRTAEPVSRDQILRRERGQGKIHFPCSTDHEQRTIGNHTRLIHTSLKVLIIHTPRQIQ